MDIERLQQAFLAADKAGDTKSATVLAQALRSMMPPPEPPPEPPPSPQADSGLKTAVKTGLLGQPAVAGALAGMGAGQAMIPIPFVGAILGRIAGGYLGDKATQAILQAMPETAKKLGIDPETLERNEKAHPVITHLTELATQMEGFRIGNPMSLIGSAEKLAAKTSGKTAEEAEKIIRGAAAELTKNRASVAGNAALGAVMDIGQQKLSNPDGNIDWARAGEQALVGSLLHGPTKMGEAVMGAGERAVPWRKTPPKENLPASSEAKAPPASSPSSGDDAAAKAEPVDPNHEKVLAHVESDERSIPTLIAKATGIKTTEVSQHLRALQEEGKVTKKGNDWVSTKRPSVAVDDLLGDAQHIETAKPDIETAKPDIETAKPDIETAKPKTAKPRTAKPKLPDVAVKPPDVKLPFEGKDNVEPAPTGRPTGMPAVDLAGDTDGVRLPMERNLPGNAVPEVPLGGGMAVAEAHPEIPDGRAPTGDSPLVKQNKPKPPALQTEAGAPPLPPDKLNFTPRAVEAITERGNIGEALYHLSNEAGGTPKPGEEPSPYRDLAHNILQSTEDKPIISKKGEPKVDEKLLKQERARLTQEIIATRAPEPPAKIIENFRDVHETTNGTGPSDEQEARFIANWKARWADKNPRGLTEAEKASIETKLEAMRKDPNLSQKYETQRLVPLPQGWTNAEGEYHGPPREKILDEHGNHTGEYKTPDPTEIPKRAFNSAALHVEGVSTHPEAQKKFDDMNGKGKNTVAFGHYDSGKNAFHFLKAGLNDRTILHEAVHAATVRTLRDYLVYGGKNLTVVQREAAEHVTKIFGTAKEKLGGKWREAFKNEYEFVAWGLTHKDFQRDLAGIRDVRLKKYTDVEPINGKIHNLLSQFAGAVMRMLKIKPGDRAGNALLELIHTSGDLFSQPKKGMTGVPDLNERVRKTKEAEPRVETAIEEDEASRAKTAGLTARHEPLHKIIWRMLSTHTGREDAIKNFQNARRYVDEWTRYLNVSEKDHTNLSYSLDTAESKADIANQRVRPHMRELETAIRAYAEKAGLSGDALIQRLHTLAIAKHEAERRYSLWVENVRLSTKENLLRNGKPISAADWRKEIMTKLHSAENLQFDEHGNRTDIDKKLYKKLEWLAEHHADEEGYSPRKGLKVIDKNDKQFNVAGDFSAEKLKAMRDLLKAEEAAHPELERVFEAKRALDEETKQLDRESGMWSQPVENITSARGWKNYMALKSASDTAAFGNHDITERTRSDLAQFADASQGRRTDSENPFVQAFTDARRAASRLGRNGVTAEIARLAAAKMPEFKKLGPVIKFEDRYTQGLSKEDLNAKNVIFHTLPNGDLQRYRITDDRLAEAIKGTFHEVNPIFRGANAITGSIGRFHTRYNFAFAPYNFVRHAMTSGPMIGTEKGIGTMGKMMGNVVATVANTLTGGGFIKAARMAKLYENNDMEGLRKLAENGDAYTKDIYRFLTNGGFVKFQKSFGGMDKAHKDLRTLVGPSMVATKVEHIQKYFDIWNDTFEFAGRAAAFGPIEENILARMKSEGHDITSDKIRQRATEEAVAYTKNLFNYSKAGKYGREAGAMFMFLRPAMTTAVRSIDAISPAFQKAESLVPHLPKAVQADPAAIAKFTEAHNKQQKAARYMLLGMMSAGAGMYAMSYLGAEKDDEGRNKIGIDDMSLWTRNIRLPLHGLGGKENDYLQIPWGFGLGAWGALGAQLAAVASGHIPLTEALANMIPAAMDSYLPLPVAKFNPAEHPLAWTIISALPTFARPAVEYAMNVDEFGKEIFNSRMNQFGNAYSGGDTIPEFYNMAARMLSDATNGSSQMDPITIEPNTLHFFANSYIDGLARIAHNSTGLGLLMAGQKDFDPKHDLVVLDNFLGRASSYDAREFSDIEKKIIKQKNIIKMYEDAGQQEQLEKFEDANPNARMMINIYNQQVNGTLKTVRHQMKLIRESSDMSPKEKHEELQELRKNRDWIMRDIIDRVNDYS